MQAKKFLAALAPLMVVCAVASSCKGDGGGSGGGSSVALQNISLSVGVDSMKVGDILRLRDVSVTASYENGDERKIDPARVSFTTTEYNDDRAAASDDGKTAVISEIDGCAALTAVKAGEVTLLAEYVENGVPARGSAAIEIFDVVSDLSIEFENPKDEWECEETVSAVAKAVVNGETKAVGAEFSFKESGIDSSILKQSADEDARVTFAVPAREFDGPVTLTARYAGLEAEGALKVKKFPRCLVRIESVEGGALPAQALSRAPVALPNEVVAVYADGSEERVQPEWSAADESAAAIEKDGDGNLSIIFQRTGRQDVVARYAEKGAEARLVQSVDVSMSEQERLEGVESIRIEPAECSLDECGIQTFKVVSTYADGSTNVERVLDKDDDDDIGAASISMEPADHSDRLTRDKVARNFAFTAPRIPDSADIVITASLAGKTCQATIHVNSSKRILSSLSFDIPGEIPACEDFELPLATATYEDGFTARVSPVYESSDSTILRVNGRAARGIDSGEARKVKVKASYTQGKGERAVTKTCEKEITILEKTRVTALSVDPASATVVYGASQKFVVSASYNNGKPSQAVAASVSCSPSEYSGQMALGEGNAFTFTPQSNEDRTVSITFSFEGQECHAEVEIKRPRLSAISFSVEGEAVHAGQQLNLPVMIDAEYEGGLKKSVRPDKYTSSDESLAVVRNGNVLKTLAQGSVEVQAEYTEEGITKTCARSVEILPAILDRIQFALARNTVKIGKSIDLPKTVSAIYTDGTQKDVAAAFSIGEEDGAFAKIEGGSLAGLAEGSATVTASYTEGEGDEAVTKTLSVVVTVMDKEAVAIAIAVDGEKTAGGAFRNGGSITLSARATFDDGTEAQVDASYAFSEKDGEWQVSPDAQSKTALAVVPPLGAARKTVTATASFGGAKGSADFIVETVAAGGVHVDYGKK